MESLLHTLGLCGEKHLSVIAFMLEYPNISHIITYIKTVLRW